MSSKHVHIFWVLGGKPGPWRVGDMASDTLSDSVPILLLYGNSVRMSVYIPALRQKENEKALCLYY